MFLLSRTRFALYLTAIKSDERVSDLMGLDVRAFQVAAFVLGSAIAGIGGGLYAHHFSFIEAQYFSFRCQIFTVLYVLLGGTQSVWGPLVGAIFFTLLPELLRASAGWRFVMFAVIIIVVMALRPQGLVTTDPAASSGELHGSARRDDHTRPCPRKLSKAFGGLRCCATSA